jgi:hypothetical protein
VAATKPLPPARGAGGAPAGAAAASRRRRGCRPAPGQGGAAGASGQLEPPAHGRRHVHGAKLALRSRCPTPSPFLGTQAAAPLPPSGPHLNHHAVGAQQAQQLAAARGEGPAGGPGRARRQRLRDVCERGMHPRARAAAPENSRRRALAAGPPNPARTMPPSTLADAQLREGEGGSPTGGSGGAGRTNCWGLQSAGSTSPCPRRAPPPTPLPPAHLSTMSKRPCAFSNASADVMPASAPSLRAPSISSSLRVRPVTLNWGDEG